MIKHKCNRTICWWCQWGLSSKVSAVLAWFSLPRSLFKPKPFTWADLNPVMQRFLDRMEREAALLLKRPIYMFTPGKALKFRRLQPTVAQSLAAPADPESTQLVPMPSGLTWRNGGTTQPCDMLVGPCCCRATHRISEWRLYRP